MTAARSKRSMRSTSRPADGVVGRPLRPGEAGSNLRGQARQRRRGKGLGQDRKARAAIRGMRLRQFPPGHHEIVPGFSRALQPDRLRAVRIVEAEHRRLDAHARAPQRRWVRWVSLDLGRPSFVALDDQAVGASMERHRRGVVARNPGDDLLRRSDIRDDLFDRPPAPREPRER